MPQLTSKQARECGPSRLPSIELSCKLMTNTTRFSKDVVSILRKIGVPDCVFRDTTIEFTPDAESKIPEGFVEKLKGEFEADWDAFG